jgi:8-oxo-dGTP pyrophosphatase MutT (NUDIX family)
MAPASYRQRVPRPASARPGPPPPWAALPLRQRSSVSVGQVQDAIAGAGDRTAESRRVGAAVLVPVFAAPPDGEATVVLTRRSLSLQRDPGHVAFPGGRVEAGEAPADAALREAHEEVGLDPDDVEICGLVDVVGRRAGEQIAAFLGVLPRPPALAPNASEVESVLEVPLAALLADGVAWQERWSVGQAERSVHFFADAAVLGDDLVWGVSARILWRLLDAASAHRARVDGASA